LLRNSTLAIDDFHYLCFCDEERFISNFHWRVLARVIQHLLDAIFGCVANISPSNSVSP